MKITRVTCFEVMVPAKKGAIEGQNINKPLHKLAVEGKPAWTIQFDKISKLIIKMELASGLTGWGELYRGHNHAIVREIIAILLNTDIESLVLQKLPFEYSREYDGFECAIWDVFAKMQSIRVVDLLGGPLRNKVKVGAWSSHRHLNEIEELVTGFSGVGYDCIKFKSDLEDDIVSICRIIADAAPGMQVIIDANERWDYVQTCKRLDRLKETGNVLCLEDPISRRKLDDYSLLRGYSSIPIVLHVSLPYLAHGQRIKDAIQALQFRAVDGFNFNCGLADFQRLDHIASAAELPCWHGSEIDLGILEAMYVHSSAAAASCRWPSDIFGRMIREHDLLKSPLRFEPPYVFLPDGPGLGIEIDEDALSHYTTAKKEFY